jgi:hypothetical protein
MITSYPEEFSRKARMVKDLDRQRNEEGYFI